MTGFRNWSPTYDLVEAASNMDRLLDSFFGYGGTATPTAERRDEIPTFRLPVDVIETEEAYVLTASVAGFRPEQVDVTWHEGILTIHAKAERLEWKGQWLRQERPYGSFYRRLELPKHADSGKIQASFDNGLLTISVPKPPRPEPVKIPVGGSQKQLAS